VGGFGLFWSISHPDVSHHEAPMPHFRPMERSTKRPLFLMKKIIPPPKVFRRDHT
jgi:hypothetical protein